MKPELVNLYTLATTGPQNDFVLSFFYEWRETEDGKTAELKKEKVASVVLSKGDMLQLTETLKNVAAKLNGGDKSG